MRRPDGYPIKNMTAKQRLLSHVMTERSDAMNMIDLQFDCTAIDDFVKTQASDGNTYTYLHIIVASIVRLMARRPRLNRFVINGRLYQHYDITVVLPIKKRLRDDMEHTTIKVHFTGEENLLQIKQMIDDSVSHNVGNDVYNNVDSLSRTFYNHPQMMLRLGVGACKWLDNHNMLPANIINTTPFHNSILITYLKSIKGEAIFHHCSNFGTTSIFLGIGSDSLLPCVSEGKLNITRQLTIGCVFDDRFCHSHYLEDSLQLWHQLLDNPQCLLDNYDLDSVELCSDDKMIAEHAYHKKQLARRKRRHKA